MYIVWVYSIDRKFRIVSKKYLIQKYKVYLGSHFPVILFLRLPLGHLLTATGIGKIPTIRSITVLFLSQSPVILFLRLPLGHLLTATGVRTISMVRSTTFLSFLSQSPVILFLRLPLGQRFLLRVIFGGDLDLIARLVRRNAEGTEYEGIEGEEGYIDAKLRVGDDEGNE
jgi:hypothetical protein